MQPGLQSCGRRWGMRIGAVVASRALPDLQGHQSGKQPTRGMSRACRGILARTIHLSIQMREEVAWQHLMTACDGSRCSDHNTVARAPAHFFMPVRHWIQQLKEPNPSLWTCVLVFTPCAFAETDIRPSHRAIREYEHPVTGPKNLGGVLPQSDLSDDAPLAASGSETPQNSHPL